MATQNTSNGLAIEVERLTKSFGDHIALSNVNLSVREGECLAVLGPNGAGKTTLVKILSTLSKPSEGNVHVAGIDARKNAASIRRSIGVVSHQTFLYDNLTAYENLMFYGKMYEVDNIEQRIGEVLDLVEMRSRRHNRIGTLSRGMQQRLSIARAILHDPPVLLLDEPDTGLDQHATAVLHQFLRNLTTGHRTVLLTTHQLEHGLEISDRVMILHKGKIAFEKPSKDLDPTKLEEAYYECTGVSS